LRGDDNANPLDFLPGFSKKNNIFQSVQTTKMKHKKFKKNKIQKNKNLYPTMLYFQNQQLQ